LIQSGAAVNTEDHEGKTALMYTSGNGYLNVAQELLDNGAAINTQSNELSSRKSTNPCNV
jgi:ankyrin repeat protein